MKVLITGAGTLGKAFAAHLYSAGYNITLVDNNEWALAALNGAPYKRLLDSYVNVDWAAYDLVIHTAAYKHVDLCEKNKKACRYNNVNLYGLALTKACGQAQVLFISTDKAVEPLSVYGKTKEAGEKLTKEYGGLIARLGNIKLSTGSVIPIWEQTKAEGKPLPVTDPEMSRYMIDVDEAVAKIWALYPQASAGDVIIPAMGDPIRLGDLIHSLYPGYPQAIIGKRPGEKQHEKLKWDTEQVAYEDANGQIVR